MRLLQAQIDTFLALLSLDCNQCSHDTREEWASVFRAGLRKTKQSLVWGQGPPVTAETEKETRYLHFQSLSNYEDIEEKCWEEPSLTT